MKYFISLFEPTPINTVCYVNATKCLHFGNFVGGVSFCVNFCFVSYSFKCIFSFGGIKIALSSNLNQILDCVFLSVFAKQVENLNFVKYVRYFVSMVTQQGNGH